MEFGDQIGDAELDRRRLADAQDFMRLRREAPVWLWSRNVFRDRPLILVNLRQSDLHVLHAADRCQRAVARRRAWDERNYESRRIGSPWGGIGDDRSGRRRIAEIEHQRVLDRRMLVDRNERDRLVDDAAIEIQRLVERGRTLNHRLYKAADVPEDGARSPRP